VARRCAVFCGVEEAERGTGHSNWALRLRLVLRCDLHHTWPEGQRTTMMGLSLFR
jgi:hypothetical protein